MRSNVSTVPYCVTQMRRESSENGARFGRFRVRTIRVSSSYPPIPSLQFVCENGGNAEKF